MNLNYQTLLAVGIGGFLGATTRFYINTIVSQRFPSEIPLATLTVNIIGSFLIGALIAIFLYYNPTDNTRGFLITGFLGALTTYSTFAIESYFLLGSSFMYAIINILLNVFGTIIAAGSGYKLLHYFFK
ncbi:MAG: fluoride efflux transporter CrcB [Epsilonproteobacteria bacterium]|nr:MAG: fluoride efflux transporter CrcB [Campylobacterota bacterium]